MLVIMLRFLKILIIFSINFFLHFHAIRLKFMHIHVEKRMYLSIIITYKLKSSTVLSLLLFRLISKTNVGTFLRF